ncbi:unnamed protein product [Caenorhabditis nigoni]
MYLLLVLQMRMKLLRKILLYLEMIVSVVPLLIKSSIIINLILVSSRLVVQKLWIMVLLDMADLVVPLIPMLLIHSTAMWKLLPVISVIHLIRFSPRLMIKLVVLNEIILRNLMLMLLSPWWLWMELIIRLVLFKKFNRRGSYKY